MRISVSIIALVFCIGVANASGNEVIKAKERSMACGDLLYRISRLSNSIKTHEMAISWNAEDRKKAKTSEQKEKLYQSTVKNTEGIKNDYGELASVVTIYKVINCSESDLIHELYCPKGWSEKCK